MDRNANSEIDNYFVNKLIPLILLSGAAGGAVGGLASAFITLYYLMWFIST